MANNEQADARSGNPTPRVEMVTGLQAHFGLTSATHVIELGTKHVDGYQVTVGWSEEDASWIARCAGMKAFIPGYALGTGATQMAALCDLACALAATVDCMGQALDDTDRKSA